MCYHGRLHLMNCAGEAMPGMKDTPGKRVGFPGEKGLKSKCHV